VAFVLGVLPALPLGKAGRYVAAAYIVVFAVVLIYVAIMALRLSRMERELGELAEEAMVVEEEAAPPLVEETTV
jgi:CcmD family protein